jgi:hypothetical protein
LVVGESRQALRHAERAFAAFDDAERYSDAAMVGVHLSIGT